MSTLRQAAELLSGPPSLASAEAIAKHLGFDVPRRMSAEALSLLEVEGIRSASVATGTGVLRCFVLVARAEPEARQVAARTLRRLTEQTPHVLWTVVLAQPAHALLIVAVAPSPGVARISALAAD